MKYYLRLDIGTAAVDAPDILKARKFADELIRQHRDIGARFCFGVYPATDCPEEFRPISEPYLHRMRGE